MKAAPKDDVERVLRQADPQPWNSPEDAKGWRVVARGSGRPGPMPKIRLVVDLDDAQSDWLRREAARTGSDYIAVVKQLIDEKLAAGSV